MKLKFTTQQAGYALILMVLVMMGIGGVVLAGFTQQARKDLEVQRYQHNQRVLEQAKQALLMYAYNYPQTNITGQGPGRLPCPDNDNDGGAGTPATCNEVGRFPWAVDELAIQETVDASGERLWYAVSDAFDNIAGGGVINSDTTGTITLVDQSGGILYDGNGAGIAAIIIAPGPITRRDEDNDGAYEFVQVRDTVAQQRDPRNYLDTLAVPAAGANNEFDNSVFTNVAIGTNGDGFIIGPIFDPTQGDIVVNDQIIIVTAAEVIAMAGKATLQAYRDEINEYIDNIGIDAYPWLDDYTTVDLTLFDGDVNTRIGRVPSIFSNYFKDDSENPALSQSITSDLEMLDVQPTDVNGFDVLTILPGVISANATIQFSNNGDLIITPSANGASFSLYYWDEKVGADGWQQCLPVVIGTEQDCNQALAAPGVPDSSIVPNEVETRVVRVTYTNNLVDTVPYTRLFTESAGLDPQYQAPTAVAHARISLEYAEVDLLPFDEIGVDYEYDDSYLALPLNPVQTGNFNYSLGVTYYPELPDWARTNLWHDSVQVSFAAGYAPGAGAVCAPPNCITVANTSIANNDKISVLVLASDHDMGVDSGAAGYQDDLAEIFDLPHREFTGTEDDLFDARPNGNDKILIIN